MRLAAGSAGPGREPSVAPTSGPATAWDGDPGRDGASGCVSGPGSEPSSGPGTAPDPTRRLFAPEAESGAGPGAESEAEPGAESGSESTNGSARRERRRGAREQTPAQRALGLLTRREHSRKELTRKLTARGLDRDEVEAAVGRLAEAGWQDDTRFAESLVRARANNGYGPLHIRAELGTHGLDSQAVAEALQGYEGDWLENARELVRRRFGEGFATDPARRRKAADLLVRRGFDAETVRNASRSRDPD